MDVIADEALVVIPPEGGALALTVPADRALAFFTRPGAVEPILDAIRKEIDAFTADVSTVKGRKEIASMAHKVAQSKSHLESVGKRLADEQKEIPKKIDASRKKIRDTLDAWKDEVRRPLTEWEEREADRIQKHRAAIDRLTHAGREPGDCPAGLLREALAKVEAVQISKEACEEFVVEYAGEKDMARIRLTDAIAKAEKREAEAAELARLRAAEEARLAKEREGAAARERAEREARIAEEARQKAEADAKRREEALRLEKEAAERRAKEAEEKAERERQDAILRQQETEARMAREAEAAKAREEEEARRRAANKAHRARINNAAAAAFVAGGLSEGAAKTAVELIARQQIPAVAISY